MVFKAILIWNTITLLLMGIDKWKAKHHKYRISERTLLLSGFLFGSLGIAVGMLIFHHKIRKAKFIYFIPFFMILHALILLKLVISD